MNLLGPYLFYNKTVTLQFDPDKHVYYRNIDGGLVPVSGVTSVIKILDKSNYLIPWAAKRVAEKMGKLMPVYRPELETELYTESLPLSGFLDLCQKAKTAPRDILEDAGNVGTMAHECLETSIWLAINENNGFVKRLVKLPEDERAVNCCNTAFSWMQGHNVRWLETEKKVYSLEYNYSGTADGLCRADSCTDPLCCPQPFKDRLSLADWKSSNQLDLTYRWQTAAYRHAMQEEAGHQITDIFILRLGKEKGDFEPWHIPEEDIELDFQGFLACLHLTRIHHQVKERMKEAGAVRRERKKNDQSRGSEK